MHISSNYVAIKRNVTISGEHAMFFKTYLLAEFGKIQLFEDFVRQIIYRRNEPLLGVEPTEGSVIGSFRYDMAVLGGLYVVDKILNTEWPAPKFNFSFCDTFESCSLSGV